MRILQIPKILLPKTIREVYAAYRSDDGVRYRMEHKAPDFRFVTRMMCITELLAIVYAALALITAHYDALVAILSLISAYFFVGIYIFVSNRASIIADFYHMEYGEVAA